MGVRAPRVSLDFIKDGVDTVVNTVGQGVSGISNGINSELDKTLNEANKVVTRLGVETGNGFRDLTGQNAMQRGMEENARNQERQANRLLWEKENNEAQAKEKNLQEEARKRLRAEASSGRAGTILTSAVPVGSMELGTSSGKSLLGQ